MLRATNVLVLLLAIACSDAERPAGSARVEDALQEATGIGATGAVCDDGWREVEAGLRQRSLCSGGEAMLHLVEVDPDRWTLDALRVEPTTAPTVARDSGAAFAINANFFDPDRKTLGVVVSDGETLQRPHPVSWQSIFYTTSAGNAAIVLPERWDAVQGDAAMAAQAGPRLVAEGRATGATRGKPSLRSGVCLTADDRVIFFVTTMRRLIDVDEMTDLAARGEDRGGLGCRDAMLFDGGPSAQMHLAGSGISIEGDRVPAFVIARPRDKSADGR
jgi:exopolysaccharide biosynthesis protein